MADDSINININADTSGATAGLNEVTTAAQRYSYAVNQLGIAANKLNPTWVDTGQGAMKLSDALKQTSQSAQQASSSLNQQASAVRAAGASMQQAAGEAKNFGSAAKSSASDAAEGMRGAGVQTHGVFRELVVLGHEAMSGRFSRIPGSLVVLAEYMGNVSAATYGVVAALVAAALAAEHFVSQLLAVRQAQREISDAGVIGGIPSASMDKLLSQLQQQKNLSAEVTGQVISENERMLGSTAQSVDAMSRMAIDWASVWGEKPVQAAKTLAGVMQNLGKEGFDFLQSKIGASKSELDDYTNAVDAASKKQVILNTMAAHSQELFKRREAQPATVGEMFQTGAQAMMAAQGPGFGAANTQVQLPQDIHAADQAKQALQDIDAVKQALANLNNTQPLSGWETASEHAIEKVALTAKLGALEQKKSNDEVNKAAAQAGLDEVNKQLNQQGLLAAQSEVLLKKKAAFEEELNRKSASDGIGQNRLMLAQIERDTSAAAAKRGEDERHIQMDVTRAKISAIQQELAAGKLAGKEKEEVETQLAELQTRLTNEEVALKTSAARAGAREAKKSLEEQLAALSTEQAADRENAAQWMALEQQKLALIASTLGQRSVLYQRELKAEAAYERENNNKIASDALEAFNKQASDAKTSLQTRIAEIRQEAEVHGQGKLQELSDTIAAIRQEENAEQTKLSALMGMWGTETKAYKQAQSEMVAIAAAANKQIQADAQKTTQQMINSWSSVNREISGDIVGLISGQKSWAQIVQQTAQQMVESLIQMGLKMVEQALIGKAVQNTMAAGSISTAAKEAAANAYASTSAIPIIGPALAPAAAAVAFGSVEAFGGGLATGTMDVPTTMGAILHPGEMVIPQTFAQGIRNTLAGGEDSGAGGQSVVINYAPSVSAIDGQSAAQFLRTNARQIASLVGNQFASQPSLRGAY